MAGTSCDFAACRHAGRLSRLKSSLGGFHRGFGATKPADNSYSGAATRKH